MSEPLSTKLGFKRKPEPTYFPAVEGYNLCLDELDQLSPDVEALARLIYRTIFDNNVEGKEHPNWTMYIETAQEIINKMSEWIKK